jgi:hypothetical protein
MRRVDFIAVAVFGVMGTLAVISLPAQRERALLTNRADPAGLYKLEAAWLKNPEDADLLAQLIAAGERQGNHVVIANALTRHLSRHPNDHQQRHRLAVAFEQAALPQQALPHWKYILEHHRLSAEELQRACRVALGCNDLGAAEAFLLERLRRQEHDYAAWLQLIQVRNWRGDHVGRIAAQRELALRRNHPDDWPELLEMARWRDDRPVIREAASHLDKVAKKAVHLRATREAWIALGEAEAATHSAVATVHAADAVAEDVIPAIRLLRLLGDTKPPMGSGTIAPKRVRAEEEQVYSLLTYALGRWPTHEALLRESRITGWAVGAHAVAHGHGLTLASLSSAEIDQRAALETGVALMEEIGRQDPDKGPSFSMAPMGWATTEGRTAAQSSRMLVLARQLANRRSVHIRSLVTVGNLARALGDPELIRSVAHRLADRATSEAQLAALEFAQMVGDPALEATILTNLEHYADQPKVCYRLAANAVENRDLVAAIRWLDRLEQLKPGPDPAQLRWIRTGRAELLGTSALTESDPGLRRHKAAAVLALWPSGAPELAPLRGELALAAGRYRDIDVRLPLPLLPWRVSESALADPQASQADRQWAVRVLLDAGSPPNEALTMAARGWLLAGYPQRAAPLQQRALDQLTEALSAAPDSSVNLPRNQELDDLRLALVETWTQLRRHAAVDVLMRTRAESLGSEEAWLAAADRPLWRNDVLAERETLKRGLLWKPASRPLAMRLLFSWIGRGQANEALAFWQQWAAPQAPARRRAAQDLLVEERQGRDLFAALMDTTLDPVRQKVTAATDDPSEDLRALVEPLARGSVTAQTLLLSGAKQADWAGAPRIADTWYQAWIAAGMQTVPAHLALGGLVDYAIRLRDRGVDASAWWHLARRRAQPLCAAGDPEAFTPATTAAVALGQLDEAMAFCQGAPLPQAAYDVGHAALGADRLDLAKQALLVAISKVQALGKDPYQDPKLRHLAGVIAITEERFDEAVTLLSPLAQTQPWNRQLAAELAHALERSGHQDAAYLTFQRAAGQPGMTP